MADKFFQLVSFVVNICPDPLRKMLLKYAKADKGTTFTSLDAYLAFRKNDISNCRNLRKDQLNLIYRMGSDADESQWDVSLLATLITELFKSSITGMDKFQIQEIRRIRNTLQHLPNSSSMTDGDYELNWNCLETATLALANTIHGPSYEKDVRAQINELRNEDVANIGHLLKVWYEEHIREMADNINQLNSKIDKMVAATKETASLVRGATVQKPGPAGEKYKRFKTVDNILSRLLASFDSTMQRELRDSFDPPAEEVAEIRTHLRDKHHVVVSGSFSSRYLETALAAINNMEYIPARCVEISESSDWRHIDPKDVDLVLFRNPFGEVQYEETKAKSVADIFSSMLLTSIENTSAERIDIVLVTESRILADVKLHHDHEILENDVKVFDATTEKQPADLTLGPDTSVGRKSHFNPVASNLREFTKTFIHHYSGYRSPPEDDIKTARETFKKNKVIVLVCPQEYGKVLAVALASSYKPSQCLLLTRPDDTLLVDSDVCLAIIDQFAGKYRYDEEGVLKWYEMFDHLQLAVKAGKLNVIVTCEKENIEQCRKVFKHALLENKLVLDISEDDYNAVKNEDVSDEPEGKDITDQSSTVQSRQQKRHKKVKRNYHGEFPIHIAAKKPNRMELQNIIDSGADVNARDFGDWTPLHEACYKGIVDNAECLLLAGASVHALGEGNNTPLHEASASGNIELVEMLLNHGADPNQRSDDGMTPADVASTPYIKAKIDASCNKTVIPSEIEMTMSDVID